MGVYREGVTIGKDFNKSCFHNRTFWCIQQSIKNNKRRKEKFQKKKELFIALKII